MSLRYLIDLETRPGHDIAEVWSRHGNSIPREVCQGTWIYYYTYAESHFDRLVGLLDEYLQAWTQKDSCPHDVPKSFQLESSVGMRSPLHFCSAFGCKGLAKALLQMGINLNSIAAPSGQSPLHLAAAGGHIEVITLLLERGADMEVRTVSTGRTPLQLAAFRGRTDVVELLLRKGADSNKRDNSGLTASAIASASGYTHIAILLQGNDLGSKRSAAANSSSQPKTPQILSLPYRTRVEQEHDRSVPDIDEIGIQQRGADWHCSLCGYSNKHTLCSCLRQISCHSQLSDLGDDWVEITSISSDDNVN